MRWFITKLVFNIADSGAVERQFEEQWRMVAAEDRKHAFKKALDLGAKEAEEIIRDDGSAVKWEFIAVTDMIEFNPDSDGAEVHSSIASPEEPENYLRFVQQKAACIPLN